MHVFTFRGSASGLSGFSGALRSQLRGIQEFDRSRQRDIAASALGARASRAEREEHRLREKMRRFYMEGVPIHTPPEKVQRIIENCRGGVSRHSAFRGKVGSGGTAGSSQRGTRNLFMKASYIGHGGGHHREGAAAKHELYIREDEALEHWIDEETGEKKAGLISTMGETEEDAILYLTQLEALEKIDRGNGKIMTKLILELPHGVAPETRFEMSKSVVEFLEGFGLQSTAAMHLPDPGGDERNYHLHINYSTRPARKIGEGTFQFGAVKVDVFEGQEGFKRLRKEIAGCFNQAFEKAGCELRYEHQTYKERQLLKVGQVHLGPKESALNRRGVETARARENREIEQWNSRVRGAIRDQHLRAQEQKIAAERAAPPIIEMMPMALSQRQLTPSEQKRKKQQDAENATEAEQRRLISEEEARLWARQAQETDRLNRLTRAAEEKERHNRRKTTRSPQPSNSAHLKPNNPPIHGPRQDGFEWD